VAFEATLRLLGTAIALAIPATEVCSLVDRLLIAGPTYNKALMKHETKPTVVHGTVTAFNLSPRGRPDGLLVEPARGPVIQVNFPKEGADDIAQAVRVGEPLTATVSAEPDGNGADHPVYQFISLGEARTSLARVEGIVVRVNYARHGEPNGAVLDVGDFVHLRPEGAKALDLRVGQHLSVDGEAVPAADGRRVVEAHAVNGIVLSRKAKPPKPRDKKEKRRDAVEG
jgi:hypothetical protein